MAKQLNYTSPAGITLTNSYWRIIALEADLIAKKASFTFAGYKDIEARNAGKSPIAHKTYVIDGVEFETEYAAIMAKTKNPAEVGYALCSRLDVEVTENGVSSYKSFFDGAVDV